MLGFLAVYGEAQENSTKSPTSDPTHLISVPRVVHPGVPVTISVTILTKSPVLVVSEIVKNNASLSRTESTITAGSTELQVLPPVPEDDQSSGSPYELVVKGYISGVLLFSNSAQLQYMSKSVSILLQTDKPRYKPGQDVKIRALLINRDGKPYNKPVDIFIRDPKDNLIHQWLNVSTTVGLVSKEFQLTENPSLGFWKIQATMNKYTQEKFFDVSHYVLPKFEVLLDVPNIVYYTDNLTYTVTARYLNGKPVVGDVSVIYNHGYYYGMMTYEKFKINGQADLSFNFSATDRFNRSGGYWDYWYYDYITVDVTVTELLTGVNYSSSAQVSITPSRYNLQFQDDSSTLKPFMNFSTQLKVSTLSGRPLTTEEQKHNVTFTITQQTYRSWMPVRVDNFKPVEFVSPGPESVPPQTASYYDPNISVMKLQLPVPADGVVPLQFGLSEKVDSLTIEAKYEDQRTYLYKYKDFTSPSESYMTLRRTSSPQIGQPLHMSVQSSFPLTEFHYMVISRDQLVAVGTLTSPDFTLTPDISWVPLATVFVYCVRPSGEVVNDALGVSFTQVLKNNVSLKWQRETAEPAENLSLSISVSEPGSLVGLLVVDKANQDSDRSNDITEQRVIQELAAYSASGFWYWWGNDPSSVFMRGGVMVITDANLESMNIYPEAFRPMMMNDMVAMDSAASTSMSGADPRQRRNFPETWLWLDVDMRESTTSALTVTVPDSMTSWVATAFVISENLGLGISSPAELSVSQDFFISLTLPVYLIRGELLLLQVSLFNYMDQDQEVVVKVAESDRFDFVTSAGDGSALDGVQTVTVAGQSSVMVPFAIRATKLGQMPISVKALGSSASDAVYQTILVKAEGREQSFTQTLFLEFSPGTTSVSRELKFEFPQAAVPGSLSARVTAVGDLLGPSINGLESLIEMPYGCGEQNMINFAPNVYVLQYLNKTGKVNEETRSKALKYMKQGYEGELSYQRFDDSFSAFGESDPSGSTWLSAFVLRCFLQARPFIYIDDGVLSKTVSWLSAQQNPDGSFNETGRVIHTELQGGLDGPVSLTSYVLMALLEDSDYSSQHADAVSAAVKYLTSRLNQGISSNYSLCLVTYALSLARSPAANSALTQLMNRADMNDGVPMWSAGGGLVSNSWQPRSSDIEMVSYTMLSLYTLGSVEQGLGLMKWLSQQRNHLGGYGSTQDTIIALQALSAYASMGSTEQINLQITVTSPASTLATFTIDSTNYLIYQNKEIEAENPLNLQVSATGNGFALVQLTTFYNILTQEPSRKRRDASLCEGFDLNVNVMDSGSNNMDIEICFSLCENQEVNQTGMAILDVGLLTGFSLSESGVPTDELVRKVDPAPGKVIIYLDSVTKKESCVRVPSSVEFQVAGVQDAAVTIYDYYEPRRKTVRTYTSMTRKEVSTCFFCGGDCSLCEVPEPSVFDGVVSSHQKQSLVLSLALALLIILALRF
ncbi:CD109 antigen [Trichomycterus rosablanca]|uniref:CD109 antigen n=1 Tax=Trichomycterus rosablanca TaxID=2290929 RepID=UPI002F3522F1